MFNGLHLILAVIGIIALSKFFWWWVSVLNEVHDLRRRLGRE